MSAMVAGLALEGLSGEVAGRLYAGTARVEITPPAGIAMCGYGERTGGAQGVHDPLFARVLVLSDGQNSLALVAADLVWLYSQRIVEEVRRQWALDPVVLCGSHTHSGPSVAPGAWYTAMEDKVIAAIGEARGRLFPARVRAGQGPVDAACFGYNRRFVRADGKVEMWWDNPDHRPNGPTDPLVRVLCVDDEQGRPRAVLVHHAAHSVVLGSGNVHISADYPGAMVAHVERELGPGAMAMFLQGGGGDVHPYAAIMRGDAGFEAVARTGRALGESALRIVAALPTPPPVAGCIKVREQMLSMAYRDDPSRKVDVAVMAVMVGPDVALAVLSGEPFVQHQLDLAARSPVKNTFLLGYAYFGRGMPLPTYLPSRRAIREGGYGSAAGSANFLEVGAGERMIDAAVAAIQEIVAAP